MKEKRYMIFHIPFKLEHKAKEASGIRPIKMLNAFKETGYEVIEITGYSKERKKKIDFLKNEVSKGKKIDFVYSESSTMPTLLTDPNRIPSFVDFYFFSFCKKKNIPIGLFYRDIYWKFPEHLQMNPLKEKIAILFYNYDLHFYKKYISKIYIPSMPMAQYLENLSNIIDYLPPGCDLINLEKIKSKEIQSKKTINFLYIGGLGNHYRLHHIFNSIANNVNFTLTICTRRQEWESHSSEYIKDDKMPSNIFIVHFFAGELNNLYKNADIVVLYVEPLSYWNFAVPFKLFEYIGHGKPILASASTYVGEYVARMKIGWAIQYNIEAIDSFLANITHKEIVQMGIKISHVASYSRWVDRAKKVINDMKKFALEERKE